MKLLEKLARLVVPQKARSDIRDQDAFVSASHAETQAWGHFQLAGIYREEAKPLSPLRFLYRYLSNDHLEQSLVLAVVLPGPLGMKAEDQIRAGDFWEGLKNLETEISRL